MAACHSFIQGKISLYTSHGNFFTVHHFNMFSNFFGGGSGGGGQDRDYYQTGAGHGHD